MGRGANLPEGGMVRSSVTLLLLLACNKDPVIEVIPGVTSDLEISLVNPTECGACDPFRGVDTLKVEVTVGEDEVASDSFTWPDEAVTLPDVSAFGVIRVQLLGLEDGRVVSAGRTPEIVLMPGESQSVPMMFLPANTVLPLAASMLTARSRHTSFNRRDGSVVLVGGQDAFGERALGTSEIWSLDAGFVDNGSTGAGAAADMMVSRLSTGDVFLTGGYATLDGKEVAADGSTVWNETDGVFEAAGSLSAGRRDGCFALFEDRKGLAIGGGPDNADYLKPNDSGAWEFTELGMVDLEETAVSGCAALGDGDLFVQGTDATGTGLWDGGSKQPSQAFVPIVPGTAGEYRYVTGAAILSPSPGVAWILGGEDAETGQVLADGRAFSADEIGRAHV